MPENETRVLIGTQVGANNIKKVSVKEAFTHICQGGVELRYQLHDLVFTTAFARSYLAEHDAQPPLFGVSIQEPKLGQGVILTSDRLRLEDAAAELTDPLCEKAGCASGANCLFKRKL